MTAGSDLPVQYTDLRGATIAWTEQGPTAADAAGSSTVVWAHGLSSTRDASEQAGMFDWSGVAQQHRLVRYDARGHGQSSVSPDPGAYDWRELGDDLLALLDEVAPGETVAGIGTSMGTATLLYAALRDPARFTHLVLTGPPTAWETRRAQAAMYEQLATVVEQQGIEALDALSEGMAVIPAFADLGEGPFGLTGESAPTVFRGAATADLPEPALLAGLDVPVLLLAWAQDPGHPVSSASLLAEYLPNAVMRVAATPAQLARWGGYAADFLAPARSHG